MLPDPVVEMFRTMQREIEALREELEAFKQAGARKPARQPAAVASDRGDSHGGDE